jgi:mRNA interferase RelE/StbE
MIEVHISPAARREIRKLNKKAQRLIMRALEALQYCPRPPKVEKLQGHPDYLRLPVGRSHRMIYTIISSRLLIVLVIRDRKDAYRGIDNLGEKLRAAVDEIASTAEGQRLLISGNR